MHKLWLARQVLAGTGIQIAVCDRLEANDSSHTKNVVGARTAAYIGGRPIQTLAISVHRRSRGQCGAPVCWRCCRSSGPGRSRHWRGRRPCSRAACARRFQGPAQHPLAVRRQTLHPHSFRVPFWRQRARRLHLADRRMRGAAFRREGKQSHARPYAEQLPGELGCRNCDISELVNRGFRDYAAITHEQNTVFTESSILDFHHLQLEAVVAFGATLMIWKRGRSTLPLI